MNKEEFELSINMSDEEIERIKNILCASRGVRHYLLKIHNDEELDVVEYKEYQKLEQKNKELHNKIDKYKDLEQSLTFIKNRVKQGMTQENINKCAIQLVNSYLKDSDVDE